MKNLTLIILLFLTGTLKSLGQTDSICAVKIGSNYYINCKKIISFAGQSVLTIDNSSDPLIKINFDVFSEDGIKIAAVKGGKLTIGEKSAYKIKSTETEFSFIEKTTNRIICFVKRVYDEKNRRCELQVFADMFMPSGFYFQCTPETTNVEFLNWMQGSTFTNAASAIDLE